MENITKSEAMNQDQNLTTAPQTGAEKNETIINMVNEESIVDVPTLGAAIEGEQQAATVPAMETTATPDTTAAPSEEAIEELKSRRAVILEQFKAGQRVQLRDFRSAGFKFADMDNSLQRKETLKDSRQLLESLKNTKEFYRPIEVVPVSELIAEGHPCFKLDGTEISQEDPEAYLYYARADGKQRSIAYAKLMSDPKYRGKESEYSIPLILCPCPVDKIDTYVREIQTAAVWNEKTKRQTVVAKFGGEESGVTLMNHFMEETGMSARGAYKLIFRRDGYKKALYEQSMREGKLVEELQASPAVIERAKHDYTCLRIAFRNHPSYLKNSMPQDAIIDVFTSAGEDPNGAVGEFFEFLQALQPDNFDVLDSCHSISEKKTAILKLFNTHKERLSNDFDYSALIKGRVEEAKVNYETKAKKEAEAKAKAKAKRPKTSIEAKYYSI